MAVTGCAGISFWRYFWQPVAEAHVDHLLVMAAEPVVPDRDQNPNMQVRRSEG